MKKLNSTPIVGDVFKEQYDSIFDKGIEWLSCVDAAIYLRKFNKCDGSPSVGAIRNLIYRGVLRARKFGGSVFLSRSEIDRALDHALI